MKRYILIASVAVIIQIQTRAQGFYAGFGGGYSLPAFTQPFNNFGQKNGSYKYNYTQSDSSSTSSSSSTTSNVSKSYSLGSGANFNIYGGYMLTKNFGFELEFEDRLSSKTSTLYTSTNTTTITNIPPHDSTGISTNSSNDVYSLTSGNLVSLTPGIRLMASDGQLRWYMVTGLIIGFSPTVTYEDVTTVSNSSNSTPAFNYTLDQVYKISGGMMIGFHGAVGATYMITPSVGISTEFFANFMNWLPAKKILTTLSYNGADSLDNSYMKKRNLSEEIDYVSTVATSTNSSSSPTTPSNPVQSTYINFPFSSFGFKIGVIFWFGGK
jgi:hypothetical protein